MELIDQAGEVLQPLHQQGDAIEGLPAVVGCVAGQLMDLVNALIQGAGHIRLLAALTGLGKYDRV